MSDWVVLNHPRLSFVVRDEVQDSLLKEVIGVILGKTFIIRHGGARRLDTVRNLCTMCGSPVEKAGADENEISVIFDK